MIAGLPVGSWVLLGVAVGAGLAIELLFLRARLRERRTPRREVEGAGADG